MPIFDSASAVDDAIASTENLRRLLHRTKHRQVRSMEERALVKATAQAWFVNQRQCLSDAGGVQQLDTDFRDLLDFAEKNVARSKYFLKLKKLKEELLDVRSAVLTLSPKSTSVQQPDFSSLVSDAAMQRILERRWRETSSCVDAGAHLAAVVMMGGLLEGLLLARVLRMPSANPAFQTTACPKDKMGKSRQLQDWTLANYIEVAHELGWIRRSARDVSAVLRDYRNYIHPHKELAHGVNINSDDVALMRAVFTQLVEQVLKSI